MEDRERHRRRLRLGVGLGATAAVVSVLALVLALTGGEDRGQDADESAAGSSEFLEAEAAAAAQDAAVVEAMAAGEAAYRSERTQTAFGRVLSGMEVIDTMTAMDRSKMGEAYAERLFIETVTIEER